MRPERGEAGEPRLDIAHPPSPPRRLERPRNGGRGHVGARPYSRSMGKNRPRKPLPEQTRADRALCPVEVAQVLGLKVRTVAEAMRATGETHPLTVAQAKAWKTGHTEMPDWLAPLYAERIAAAAQRAAAEAARQAEAAHQELLRTERVHTKLAAGRTRFNHADMYVVEEIAFTASKELVRGLSPDDLSVTEHSALRACGVDPDDHQTWMLHDGGCDQTGGPDCGTRLLAIAQERAAEQQAARFERQLASMHAEGRIASGEFTVGQPVLTWYESRIGTIAKVNRVTVKVRFVGGFRDGYALVEKNLKPEYLHPVPVTTPPAPEVAAEVWVKDWRNDNRIYPGVVVARDGALFQVQYTLKSGQPRTAWFDRLRLTTAPATGR